MRGISNRIGSLLVAIFFVFLTVFLVSISLVVKFTIAFWEYFDSIGKPKNFFYVGDYVQDKRNKSDIRHILQKHNGAFIFEFMSLPASHENIFASTDFDDPYLESSRWRSLTEMEVRTELEKIEKKKSRAKN